MHVGPVELPDRGDYILEGLSFTRVDTAHLKFLGAPTAKAPNLERVHLYLMSPVILAIEFLSFREKDNVFPPLRSVLCGVCKNPISFKYNILIDFSEGSLEFGFESLYIRSETLRH